MVDKVDLATFAGTATYTFNYVATSIHESCQDDDATTPEYRTVPLLTSISLPANGGSFRMDGAGDYYTTCVDGGVTVNDLPGTLHRLKLPTLATTEWTYQTYTYNARGNFSPGEPSLTMVRSLGVKTKKVLDAAGACTTLDGVGCVWTYT